MGKDFDRNVVHMMDGKAAAHLHATLEDEFARQQKAIDDRVYQQLAKGETIDPQAALQAWIEKHAIHKLERKLLQRARAGQSASEHLRGELDFPENG